MTPLLLALLGAYGVHLLYTAALFGWTGVAPGPRRPQLAQRVDTVSWLRQAGLGEVGAGEFVAVLGATFIAATTLGFTVFGSPGPAVFLGVAATCLPPAAYRSRRRRRRAVAQDAWPAMIDELRVLTGAAGMSIPEALFEVGRRAPAELRDGFEAAHRAWLLSTDFDRTLSILKDRIADPTCDATCETLLVAHEIGGTDLDRRLAALVEDRLQEMRGRKDARARQAGARFARLFVLLVPLGMALAGLSLGTGREGYGTPAGQIAVGCGVVLIVGCWLWAGRTMQVPDEERVFAG